jgi:hypothetical protein
MDILDWARDDLPIATPQTLLALLIGAKGTLTPL